jgi:nucleoside-diphosphate-sugar epimerase
MTRKTVLVLGANGRFGLAAAQAFDHAGWQVLAQTRRPLDAAMPVGVRRVDVRLADTDALARAAQGATVVVHALNPIYTQWKEHALPMARAGMDVAQGLGATFMLPGNVYNYGEAMPARLSEDTPQRPTTEKGRLRCAMEAEMAARSRSTGLRSVVVRAGDFYGSGAGSWLDLAIVKSLRAGKLVYPGPLDVPHAWAYLPDFARCFVALADKDDLPAHARYHFAGHTLIGRQLLDAIEAAARELGVLGERPARRTGFPWWALRALAWAVPMWREVLEMSYLWRVPHALDGQRLAQTVGAVPSTPLPEAMRATLLSLGFGRVWWG